MENLISIFLFLGPNSRKHSRIFSSLYEARRDKEELRNYAIVDLAAARPDAKPGRMPLVFTEEREVHYESGHQNDRIIVRIPEGSPVRVTLIGDYMDIESYPADDQITFEWMPPEEEEEEDSGEDTGLPDVSSQAMNSLVIAASEFLNALTELTKKEDEKEDEIEEGEAEIITEPLFSILTRKNLPKPYMGIIVDGALYHGPANYKWISDTYLDSDLFRKLSSMVDRTVHLDMEEDEIDHLYEILKLYTSPGISLERDDILPEFNAMICNHEICNAIDQLINVEEKEHICDLKVNDNTLDYISFSYKILFSDAVFLRRTNAENVADYQTYFMRPFYKYSDFLNALHHDVKMKYSVCYFHELNRNFFIQTVGADGGNLPFYTSDTLTDEIRALQDPNYTQTVLEKKSAFYANYPFNRLLQIARQNGAGGHAGDISGGVSAAGGG